jgi:hypothetical protein
MAVFLACAFLVRYCSASVFHIFPSWGRFSVIPAPKRDAQKSRPIWPKQSYFHLKLSIKYYEKSCSTRGIQFNTWYNHLNYSKNEHLQLSNLLKFGLEPLSSPKPFITCVSTKFHLTTTQSTRLMDAMYQAYSQSFE